MDHHAALSLPLPFAVVRPRIAVASPRQSTHNEPSTCPLPTPIHSLAQEDGANIVFGRDVDPAPQRVLHTINDRLCDSGPAVCARAERDRSVVGGTEVVGNVVVHYLNAYTNI